MVEEPPAEPLDQLEEEEGGPVKSFLDHLEDLRWVLIKSAVAGGVAMLVCLLAGNHVMSVLEWPLKRATVKFPFDVQVMRVTWGTNKVGMLQLGPADNPGGIFGTNRFLEMQIVPVVIGTNTVMGINVKRDVAGEEGHTLPIEISNFGPAGAFIVATKIAFYAGLLIASPFIFYFVASFVFPALRMREKKYIYRGLFFGFSLFAIGVGFCYFVLMPVALAASAQYAKWLGLSASQWRAEEYIGFVCKFLLGMGLGFELPVVILTLVKLGVLNYRLLSKARRYVIVISFVLGAILTTPEVITQVLMAIPLMMLYEISVWIAWYWERQEKKQEARAQSDDTA